MKVPTLVYPEFLALHNPIGRNAYKLAFKKQGSIEASGHAAADKDIQKVCIMEKEVDAEVCDAFFLSRLYAIATGESLEGSLSLHIDGAGVLIEPIRSFLPPEGEVNCLDPMPWYRPMLTFPAIAVEGKRANVKKQAGWMVPHGCKIEVYLHRLLPKNPIQIQVKVLGAIYTTRGVSTNEPTLELWNGEVEKETA